MITLIKRILIASVVYLTYALFGHTIANADINVNVDSSEIEQVTSVSQLRDVEPTDWAFQALQSLVERYACIAGYPNGTFRGNRALTRYEFAAGLNACLDRVNELIATSTSNAVNKEDFSKLQKLGEEFAAELATLRGKVDILEAKTTELEANQFSTTTKLFGQAIFGIQGRSENSGDLSPKDGIKETRDNGTKINVISNLQLTLLTQFKNRSFLLTGLQAGNGGTASFNAPRITNDTRLAYEGNTDNSLVLTDLNYRFLVDDKVAVIVGPAGVNPINTFRGANRIESAGKGPISAFAQRNPILAIGNGTGGLGFDWQMNKRISLQAVYTASKPADSSQNAGLFNGGNATGVQLNLAPTNNIDLALNYINSYSTTGLLGTGVGDDLLAYTPTSTSPLTTDAFGATASWQVNPKLTIGGWGGFTTSHIPGQSGSVKTNNWMAFLNFPDLLEKGNLGGIYVGQPPKIASSDLPIGNNLPGILKDSLGNAGGQPGTTTHVEAFYRYRMSNNINITPGVILIFEPRHSPNSDMITIGVLRTTFSF
ncbi:iron uptake porin [Dolichospermum sp. ST_sed1]|nr:iron uptake porin [Dolichospermum sp. ST_sed1]MDD1423726.1 iron uptake porin [Dolichospermum sp. ST_sed9]MDD1433161.1 iron uptake porin [Dolichospermum sp. ST_sed6]MDD1445463.1 iron uptake porin [Dolichospermum sp. ST_sed8]MDD1453932.1 iron uptake porin [Dolichospermum sp. ST_sed7]MDD1459840.1 iron uptake porin [Dolichospermum sp. ST_sed2]MDD1464686.1 iron uptake porin [Dolichospermum sp. ST_sed5]MDD1473342.1 iron uptake porin [Dolichospermum sp. ST_sed4]